MKDKTSRSKRSLTVINLIQTNAGYSIIQGTELLNRVQNQAPIATVSPNSNPTSVQPAAPILKEQPKMTIKQNNLVFLKSPTNFNSHPKKNSHQIQQQNAYQQSKYFATWFNFNQISEFQKNQVKNWVEQFNSSRSTEEAILNHYLQKYMNQRNAIIQIYYRNYASHKHYLSASNIRKYICDDAKWLMKIHLFLTTWGIINSNNINFQNQNLQVSSIFKLNDSNQYEVIDLASSYYSKRPYPKNQITKQPRKNQNIQNYLALKRITSNIRPYCDYCGMHCQIVWFQHIRVMDPKQISTIMKNVNSKNPPLSQKEYEIILCTKCYCNGNFPLLLTHHDFRKISVNDKLQPDRKKKSGKNKKKQKKRKIREKQLIQQQDQFKQEGQQLDQEKSKRQKDKDNHKLRSKQKIKSEEKDGLQQQFQEQNQSQKEEGVKKEHKLNGIKQQKQLKQSKQVKQTKQVKQIKQIKQQHKDVKQTQNDSRVMSEAEKQAHTNQIIQQIISSVKKQRVWTFEETKMLLELVQKHEDDWDQIYKGLNKAGLCQDCEPEDIIYHFIRLPQMNISQLTQQNNNQAFISENKNQYKSNFLTKKIQRNFNNSMKLYFQIKQSQQKFEISTNNKWKDLLKRFVELYITKIDNRISVLGELNSIAIKEQRTYEKATKQINQN